MGRVDESRQYGKDREEEAESIGEPPLGLREALLKFGRHPRDLHALDADAALTGAELSHRFLRRVRRPPVPSAGV